MAAQRSRKRRIAVGLSLSFFSVVLSLLLLEGVLRLVTRQDYPILRVCNGPGGLRSFDPELNTKETPGGTYLIKYTKEDDWDLYTHNEMGFRDTYHSGSSGVLCWGIP